jgi:hypothetical protein
VGIPLLAIVSRKGRLYEVKIRERSSIGRPIEERVLVLVLGLKAQLNGRLVKVCMYMYIPEDLTCCDMLMTE